MHDAEKAKIDDHPLRSPAGHHIINAEFFLLVFSVFGSMGVGVHVLLKRVRKARGHLQAKLLRDTVPIALARQIAFRIRTGAGKADDWVSRRASLPSLRSTASAHRNCRKRHRYPLVRPSRVPRPRIPPH